MTTKFRYGQDKFFRCLGNNTHMMNELIQRFNDKTSPFGLLSNLMNERQQTVHTQGIVLQPRFVPDYVDGNHSAYVNYFKNGQKVFHATFHLCPDIVTKNYTPAHFSQNTNIIINTKKPYIKKRSQVIQVCNNPNRSGGLSFCTKGYVYNNQFTDSDIYDEIHAFNRVMERYFDPTDNLYLGNTHFPQHKNIQLIQSNFQRRTTPLLGGSYTRKRKQQKRRTRRI